MDIEAFRTAGKAAVDAICDYYQTLDQRTVKANVEPGYLIEQLPRQAPEHGEAFDQIAKDFNQLILPGITHWQHGQFFAYFPSISTFESMIAELYAASVSNPGFNWVCSPACTELEQVVLDWMAGLLGLSEVFYSSGGKGGGIIQGSASEAALTAAIAARERALQTLANRDHQQSSKDSVTGIPDHVRQEYGQRLVMYGSTQTHSLGAKAALLLGLQFRALPVFEKDEYRLRGDTLRRALKEDTTKGLIPFFVVATIGTTSTGAVDVIEELGQVLLDFPTAWLHVDAAWAGVALALPDHRAELRLEDLNRYADSFCTNAHKWGLVGFDCSLFYVRNRRHLTDALDVTPAFLRSKEGDSGAVIDYRNWQIALGRRFRSIKLWFVLRSYGTAGFQTHLQQGIGHCNQLAALIQTNPNFELVTRPSLALLVFRLVLPDKRGLNDDAELNLLNQHLHNHLSNRHDVFLTQTMLKSVEREIFCIRFAMGGKNTTMEHVLQTWHTVETEGAAVLADWGRGRDDISA